MTNVPAPNPSGANGLIVKVAIVIEQLSRHPTGVGPREIARTTGIDRSAVSRILVSLREAGFARQEDELGAYTPGSRLIALAHRVQKQDILASIARPVIDQLGASLNETVSLIVANGHHFRHAVVVESTHRVRLSIDEGSSAEEDMLGVLPLGDELRVDENADDVRITARVGLSAGEPAVYLMIGVPQTRAKPSTITAVTTAARSATTELAQRLN